jgi:hypothetical protein
VAQVSAQGINGQANDLTQVGSAVPEHLEVAAKPPAGAVLTPAAASPADVAAGEVAAAIQTKIGVSSSELVGKGPELQALTTRAATALQAQDADNYAQIAGVGAQSQVSTADGEARRGGQAVDLRS